MRLTIILLCTLLVFSFGLHAAVPEHPHPEHDNHEHGTPRLEILLHADNRKTWFILLLSISVLLVGSFLSEIKTTPDDLLPPQIYLTLEIPNTFSPLHLALSSGILQPKIYSYIR